MRKSLFFSLFLAAGLAYSFLAISLGETSAAYFDSLQYLQYGRNLLEQGIYGYQPGVADMNREPTYGVYLAGLIGLAKGLGLITDFSALQAPENVFWLKFFQAFVLFLSAGACSFWGALPRRVQKPFFLLVILSPTCLGAMREIYSEALAIPISLLLLCFVSRSLAGQSKLPALLSGLIFGVAVLTKSYFYFASFAFLLLGLLLVLSRYRPAIARFLTSSMPTNTALLLFTLGLGGISAQQYWNFRNTQLFGENTSEARLSIALAGKVARLERAEWPRDLPVSIAGSLGTNFCDKIYGSERCSLFDYRGCDVIGNEVRVDYEKRLPTLRQADSALKRDMFKLWFSRPITQLYGSGLELLRMFFFEAVLDAGTLPRVLQAPARAWHILGSLMLWGFILLSFTRHCRQWARLTPQEMGVALFCVLLVGYHAASMAQITNVVRYVFPILPFLYYFTADGIALVIERNRLWKAGSVKTNQ